MFGPLKMSQLIARNILFYPAILFLVTSLSVYSETKIENRPEKLKLLVVTGGPTLRHHIDLVPTSFYTLFEGYDNLNWDHASSDEAAFLSERLEEYDVLVMYNRSDSLSNTAQKKTATFRGERKRCAYTSPCSWQLQ